MPVELQISLSMSRVRLPPWPPAYGHVAQLVEQGFHHSLVVGTFGMIACNMQEECLRDYMDLPVRLGPAPRGEMSRKSCPPDLQRKEELVTKAGMGRGTIWGKRTGSTPSPLRGPSGTGGTPYGACSLSSPRIPRRMPKELQLETKTGQAEGSTPLRAHAQTANALWCGAGPGLFLSPCRRGQQFPQPLSG